MLRERVDFHIHYTDETILSILEETKVKNVKAIALVGRGEISDKIEEYMTLGKEKGIEVIVGAEILVKTGNEGDLIDVVCLGFDPKHPGIRKHFGRKENMQFNARLALKQKKFLEELAFVIEGYDRESAMTLDNLLSGKITEKAITFCWLVASNKRNDKLLSELRNRNHQLWKEMQQKYSTLPGWKGKPDMLSAKFLYLNFFAPGKPGYIPIQVGVREIIDTTHQARGIVLYSPEGDYNEGVFQSLIQEGIDGVMGWHGKRFELNKKAVRLARQKGLLILGGSDFHPQKKHWQIGEGDGSLFISFRRYSDYIAYRETLMRKENLHQTLDKAFGA